MTLIRLPFYAKASLLLIGTYLLFDILYIAQDIILPVLYAAIIGVSISPIVNFLERKKINRAISIAAVLSITLLIIVGIVFLLSSQANWVQETWPQLKVKFLDVLHHIVVWVSNCFNISEFKINDWLANAKADLIDNSNSAIGVTLTTMGGVLSTILLTPVYTFMILFYQPHLIEFIHRVFGAANDNKINEILSETKSIIQSYLSGLFIEFAIISVLNSAGLMILGIDYAILLGILGALLNVIPYLGGLIAVVLYMVIALVTKSPDYVVYVVVLYTIIQLIDNNYIVPKIVGSKVKLNALISIVAVIVGAALWGIPGMFLSIPMLAVVKLILDRIESLKPWGYLLGDNMPPLIKIKRIFK